jgi:hypothetical protein
MSAERFAILDMGIHVARDYPSLWTFYRAVRGWLEDQSLAKGPSEASTGFCEEHASSLFNSLVNDGGFLDFVSSILGPRQENVGWGVSLDEWLAFLRDGGLPDIVLDLWGLDSQHTGVSRVAMRELCRILRVDENGVVDDLDRLASTILPRLASTILPRLASAGLARRIR